LALAIFIPGAALGLAGRWSDFLIWVGGRRHIRLGIAALFNVRWRRRDDQNN
jgi:hypothetical protein